MAGMWSCLLGCFLLCLISVSFAHQGESESSDQCGSGGALPRIHAPFAPGVINVDGSDEDWAGVPGFEFRLRSAILSAAASAPSWYPGGDGDMSIRVAHDGRDLFLLLRVPGSYVFDPVSSHGCASAALIFQIGSQATLDDMGGCSQAPGQCTATTCLGHEVDLVHFEVASAIPGRVYGSNPLDNAAFSGADRFGNLRDMYAYSPHCRWVDGDVPASNATLGAGGSQNDWRGVWTHTTLKSPGTGHGGYTSSDSPFGSSGVDGDYLFEFSRPLLTSDRLNQDVQLHIGAVHKFGAAFWFPQGVPWNPSDHYITYCDWIEMEVQPGPGLGHSGTTAGLVVASLALVLAVVGVGSAGYALWALRQGKLGFEQVPQL